MDRAAVRTIAVSAHDERRIKRLERRINTLELKIRAALRLTGKRAERKVYWLIGRQRAALAE